MKKNGGTDAANAAKADKAENWLNSPASAGAGSGPYTLERLQHDLADHADAEHELLGREEVRRGRASSSATWSPRRSCSTSAAARTRSRSTSRPTRRRRCRATRTSTSRSSPRPGSSSCSRTTTRRSRRSRRTRTSRRRSATRSTTPSLVGLAGQGAIQAPGRHPVDVPRLAAAERDGSSTDLAKAKAALAASGVGEPEGDADVPERPDDQRRAVHVDGPEGPGEPARPSASTSSSRARRPRTGSTTTAPGRSAFGLSLWGPDYPDPADYLAFTPGQLVGLRAGWPKGSDPAIEKLAAKATVTTAPAARAGRLPADPAAAEPERPVLPADPADAGLRVDEGSEGRGLQRGLHRRRHAGVAGVELSSFATRAAG